MDVWKQFEQNAVTHSAAHHLMAIDTLVRLKGYARVADVARLLEITPGSVSISLRPLKSGGFVQQDENRFLRLSRSGQQLVDLLRQRRGVIVQFLNGVLGVDPHQAEIDSCKIEHLLSARTTDRLHEFLQFLNRRERVASDFLAACPPRNRDADREEDLQ